jgi:alpha/beta hydrolase fold
VPQAADRQRDPRGDDIQTRHGRGAAPSPVTTRSCCGHQQRELVPALHPPVMGCMTQMTTPRADDWRSRGNYFSWRPAQGDGSRTEIFHVEMGNPGAPVLLLIHGWPTSSIDWFEVADQLSGKFRVCALDFPGYGFSDKPQGWGYSLARDEALIEFYLSENHRRRGGWSSRAIAVTAWRSCMLPGALKVDRRRGWSTWSCRTATSSCRCRT